MRERILHIALVTLGLWLSAVAVAQGAATTQTITLKPGWNAVFLEVEPTDSAPPAVFATLDNLTSVWMWNPNTGTVEFIQNPSQLVPNGPTMAGFFPGNPTLTNLHAIHGNTAYLIQMSNAVPAAGVSFSITGEPAIPRADWKSNSFNFVGFHLAAGSEPLFTDFFAPAPALNGQEIYVLNNTTGTWVKLTGSSTRMKQGEAFWVYCKGSSSFTGPVGLQLEQSDGLHFGASLDEQDLEVKNNALVSRTVSLASSAAAAAMPLYYFKVDTSKNTTEWLPFPEKPAALALTIPAGGSQHLRLGVRRTGLIKDQKYAANLEASDGSGLALRTPVSVIGIDYAGLWVGEAVVNKVNQPRLEDNPATAEDEKAIPTKTGSEFNFRLIVYVDSAGHVKLLREVIEMWQNGGWLDDPNNYGKKIPDPAHPGQFVLLSDDSLVPQYSGAALRDGQPVGRRISAPNFSFDTPQAMTGTFGLNQSLTASIALAKDDPLNPFVHQYNPDHGKPEFADGKWSKPAEEMFDITRAVTMQFSDKDGAGNPLPGIPFLSWGSSDVGGVYKESITGLHKESINIEGTFLLHRVSSAALVQ